MVANKRTLCVDLWSAVFTAQMRNLKKFNPELRLCEFLASLIRLDVLHCIFKTFVFFVCCLCDSRVWLAVILTPTYMIIFC